MSTNQPTPDAAGEAFDETVIKHHQRWIGAPIFPPLLEDIRAAADTLAAERVKKMVVALQKCVGNNDVRDDHTRVQNTMTACERVLAAIEAKEPTS